MRYSDRPSAGVSYDRRDSRDNRRSNDDDRYSSRQPSRDQYSRDPPQTRQRSNYWSGSYDADYFEDDEDTMVQTDVSAMPQQPAQASRAGFRENPVSDTLKFDNQLAPDDIRRRRDPPLPARSNSYPRAVGFQEPDRGLSSSRLQQLSRGDSEPEDDDDEDDDKFTAVSSSVDSSASYEEEEDIPVLSKLSLVDDRYNNRLGDENYGRGPEGRRDDPRSRYNERSSSYDSRDRDNGLQQRLVQRSETIPPSNARRPPPQNTRPPEASPEEKALIALLAEMKFSAALRDFHDILGVGVQKTLVAPDGNKSAYVKIHCKRLPDERAISQHPHLSRYWIPVTRTRWNFATDSHKVVIIFITPDMIAYMQAKSVGAGYY